MITQNNREGHKLALSTRKENSSESAELWLNGFELALSQLSIKVRKLSMPDNSIVRELRATHPDWLLFWREGWLYAVPRVEKPRSAIGSPATVACSEHLWLLASLIEEQLPTKFPQYEAFRIRPFAFAGRKDELVSAICKRLSSTTNILDCFTIRPSFMLEAKIIEPVLGETRLGLFLTINTKWDITADISDLLKKEIDLSGLYVVRKTWQPGERRLIGQIDQLDGRTIHLKASFDSRLTISADEVRLEPSRASFSRCLKHLLGSDYNDFEKQRQREEANFFSGKAISRLLEQFQSFFEKDPVLHLTEDLTCTIGERVRVYNNVNYQSVYIAPPVQYYFNPARTQATPYPWSGIKQYGPFSKDTFARRTPSLLIVFPDEAQGQTESFLNHLRTGLPSSREFEGGFAKLFGLLNPSFLRCKIPLLHHANPPAAYRTGVEEYLAGNSSPDAALVILADRHAALPDTNSVYLTAKATLMLAGIATQEIRVSQLSRSPYELQYILQNLTVALYGKMNGTPWTVNQDTSISDELVIGIGTAEVTADRFGDRQKFVGITTVFRGDGNYLLGHLGKECSYAEYPEILQRTTEQLLRELKQRNGWCPGDNIRLIFHTYKPLKNIEVADIIKKAVLTVGTEQTVEFAFVTVTLDHSFQVLDYNQEGVRTKHGVKAEYVPQRGTVLQLGRYTRLLCTNGPTLIKHENAPLPSPLLLHIHKGSTFTDLTYLSEQVLKFTGLSFRSTLPAKKPVSIYYSELIADLLIRLRNVEGWTPAVLNSKLRGSRWFL